MQTSPLHFPELTIRLATHDDIAVVIKFDGTDDKMADGCRPTENPEGAPLNSDSSAHARAHLEGVITAGGAFLAFLDGSPAGYARLDFLWPERVPLLSWLYVAPDYRGRGIGQKLRAEVYGALMSRGYRSVLRSACSLRPEMIKRLAAQYPQAGTLTFQNGTTEHFFWHRLQA